eukprot:COSAG06_NODE_35869_length_454_cov_1.802817_1_plen_82_part_00
MQKCMSAEERAQRMQAIAAGLDGRSDADKAAQEVQARDQEAQGDDEGAQTGAILISEADLEEEYNDVMAREELDEAAYIDI